MGALLLACDVIEGKSSPSTPPPPHPHPHPPAPTPPRLQFLEQFLDSPVRTENPWEASLFYLPTFTYSYSDNGGVGTYHLANVIHHVKHTYPFWNRTGGRDHFFVSGAPAGRR